MSVEKNLENNNKKHILVENKDVRNVDGSSEGRLFVHHKKCF